MSKKKNLKSVDERARTMVPSWDQSILGSVRGLTDEQKRRVEEKLSPVCSRKLMLLLLPSLVCMNVMTSDRGRRCKHRMQQ